MTEKKFLFAVALVSVAALLSLISSTASVGALAFGFIAIGIVWGGVSYILERLSDLESLVQTQEEVLRQRMDAVEEYLDRKYGNPGEEDRRRGKPARIDLAKVPLVDGGWREEPKLGAISKPFVDRIIDEADQLRIREEMKSAVPTGTLSEDDL